MILAPNLLQQLNGNNRCSESDAMNKTAFRIFIFVSLCFMAMNLLAQQPVLTRKDTSEVRFINSRKFWIYKVDKGETLFSISQKFKIPQEEIHQFNPDIAANGLKAKVKLWIPAYSWAGKKTEGSSEELSSEENNKIKNRRFRVVVFSAFELPKMYTGDLVSDSGYVNEKLSPDVKENLEFLEGILIAAKDFSDSEQQLELNIHDTENDSIKVKGIFLKQEVLSADLIITNSSGAVLDAINRYSIKFKIPLFCTSINVTETLRSNELAFALLPSSLLQCALMGKAGVELFKQADYLLLKTGVLREDERVDSFKVGLLSGDKTPPIKRINFSKGYTESLKDSLNKSRLNVLFVASSNEDIVSSLLSSLREIAVDYRIAVVGLPTWLHSQSIDPKLFDTCNTILFSASHINFASPEVLEFRKKFRDHYHTEPLDAAYLGYDALHIAIEKYSHQNRKKPKDKKKNLFKGIYSSYLFDQSPNGLCFENNIIQLYKFENAVPVYFKMEDPIH